MSDRRPKLFSSAREYEDVPMRELKVFNDFSSAKEPHSSWLKSCRRRPGDGVTFSTEFCVCVKGTRGGEGGGVTSLIFSISRK